MKKIIILILLLMIPTLVNAETNYLYDVLKNEAESNGLAREYTGEHHDSFTEEPTHKIYHWYAENNNQGNQVIEKNNVIFAGYCWNIIRTTDTGGVKIIYQGLLRNNSCMTKSYLEFEEYSEYSAHLKNIGYMYSSKNSPKKRENVLSDSIVGNGVRYDNGMYTLVDTKNYPIDSTHHYTCNNPSGTCEKVKYYYFSNYYIELSDGKTIEDELNDQLYSDDVNEIDSTIKTTVETWFQEKLLEYQSQIEDTIYCNDRSIEDLGGWNPNGLQGNDWILKFKNYFNHNDLTCEHITDQFCTSNPKAKTNYPIGLITAPELVLLNNNLIRKQSFYYWTMSPYYYTDSSVFIRRVQIDGSFWYFSTNTPWGVNPVISLKKNIKYKSGDGSRENPYIIDTSNYYKVIVEESVKKGDIEFEIEDILNLQEGEEVKFKIVPNRGYELKDLTIIDEEENNVEYNTTDNINFKFTMPATDVTIKPQYKEIDSSIPNPNTKRQLLSIVISIIILGIITILFIKKKT